MNKLSFLLFAISCFFYCLSAAAQEQECDSLSHTYYTILKTPLKAGDSAVILIKNIDKSILYYDKREADGCYFSCFTGNRYDSTLSGGNCLMVDKYKLSGVLKPGETIRISVVFPKKGYYDFVFSTNKFQRPFRFRGKKHWRCIILGFTLR